MSNKSAVDGGDASVNQPLKLLKLMQFMYIYTNIKNMIEFAFYPVLKPKNIILPFLYYVKYLQNQPMQKRLLLYEGIWHESLVPL